MRTGAITTRGPASPGLSTSTTQPSTTVGSAIASAIGTATASALSLATAIPRAKQASSISGRVRTRAQAIRRAHSHKAAATIAPMINGEVAGSDLNAK